MFPDLPEHETTYEVSLALEMYGETALERLFGCLMVAVMPDRGLEEALISLRDMLDYYRQEPPQLCGTTRKLETVKGIIGDQKKRPDLVIG